MAEKAHSQRLGSMIRHEPGPAMVALLGTVWMSSSLSLSTWFVAANGRFPHAYTELFQWVAARFV